MERYDVAIIGAGPEGLVAALSLLRAKQRVILLERQGRAGGRAGTIEFHPGFRASPYSDELAAIPIGLFHRLDLPRNGALFAPAPASVCVSDEGTSIVFDDDARAWRSVPPIARDGYLSLRREIEQVKRAIEARALQPIRARERRSFLRRPARPAPWPGSEWASNSLETLLRTRLPDSKLRLHLAADAVSGRAVSPFVLGTGLHLLAPGTGRSGVAAGGLGALGAALWGMVASAGAMIRTGTSVAGLQLKRGRSDSVVLSGGEEVAARAVLSTLDVKQTFLNLVPPGELGETVLKQVSRVRFSGQRARVLIALDAPPEFIAPLNQPDVYLGPIHIAGSLEAIGLGHDAWQAGRVPEAPLVTLRVPSLTDPRLAPIGKAVLTATISAVPYRLADGAWTEAWREALGRLAIAAAERIAPGVGQRVAAIHVIVPPDIETALGATRGDLDGGEFAPDQGLDFRPTGDAETAGVETWGDARTPIEGLYLAGASSPPSPVLLGLAGDRAARAILADLNAGRLL